MPLAAITGTRQAASHPLDDGSDGWLLGVQQTAVAIASALALSVSMTAAAQQPRIQDELPVAPTEDIQWNNPVPPVPPQWNQQVTFYDSDPLPSLVDEVYWNNPVAPVVAGSDWTKPLPQVDADYQPQITVDELYWQNPVIPVPPQANLQSPVPLDADYLPQITVDDIPWVNPVPPVIAGTDWNKQPPVGPDADYIPQIGVDEQYWINPVKPQVPGADWTYQPPPVEDDYLPSLSIDDTPWVNPVAPVAPQWNVQPPTAPDADYIPQIAVSDDVWTVPVPQGSTWNIQPQIIDSDFAPPAATIVDEIYWQNPVGPWPQQANIQLVIVDEQIVSQPAVVDEVYWANPTPPWIINNIPLQQWMFDDGGLPIAPSVTTTFVVWLNDD